MERETQEQYDWHLSDIIDKAPYTHADMVYMLSQGQFIIEGKISDFSDAEYYCLNQKYSDSNEAWAALRAAEAGLAEVTVY